MSRLSVCCVCLTADRQALTDRAVRCFLAQTYDNAELFIYDTGVVPYELPAAPKGTYRKVVKVYDPAARGKHVGALRNLANGLTRCDVIAHWDSDDVSHPRRIEEQLLGLSWRGPGVTGFSNMLFYDSRPGKGHAWQYAYPPSRAHGTSLMYYRSIWEVHPFPDNKHSGEETWWPYGFGHRIDGRNGVSPVVLMVADYHGRNTSHYGASETSPPLFDQTPAQLAHNPQFQRAEQYDALVREMMEETHVKNQMV